MPALEARHYRIKPIYRQSGRAAPIAVCTPVLRLNALNHFPINVVDAYGPIAVSGADVFVAGTDQFGSGYIGEVTTSGQVLNASLISGLDVINAEALAVSGSNLFVAVPSASDSGDVAGVSEYTTAGDLENFAFAFGPGTPGAMAVSGSNLFFTDGNGIEEYSTNGTAIRTPLAPSLTAGNFAVSGIDLFAVSVPEFSNSGVVEEFNNSGTLVNDNLASGITDPTAVAVSGNDLFALDFGFSNTSVVAEYTTDGTVINASLIPNLTDPVGIAISGNDIFIADAGADVVGEYTTSGGMVNANLITGLNDPVAVAVSGSDVFVLDLDDSGNGTVKEYSTSGVPIDTSLITGLDNATAIAVSGADLLVTYGNSVGEYTRTGGTVNSQFISGLNGPVGIAVAAPNVGPATQVALDHPIFTSAGVTVSVPVGVDVDDAGGNIVTSDASTVTLSLVSGPGGGTLGGTLSEAVQNGVASFSGLSFSQPGEYTVRASDGTLSSATFVVNVASLYVVDGAAGTVGRYGLDGSTVNASLIPGLDGPNDVVISGDDLFVSTSDGNVGEYTLSGTVVNAQLLTGFGDPTGLAVSGGDLFVVDNGDGTVGEYTLAGGTKWPLH